MFGSFNGLPVHTLVLHLGVLLAPLTGVAAVALVVPAWRRRLRWPLVGLAGATVVVVFVTRQSGEVLRSNLGPGLDGTPVGAAIDEHERLGNLLMIAVLVLLGVALLAALVLPRLRSGAGTAVAAVVAVVGVVVIVLTVQVGEAGARAVWNPTGSVDYSAK